ncbi:discoidin domain-containing protein [Micromonospora mangrovi]|uniref:Discoidin domain-containing protein n=2 Tax=Micromonospora TaxID=1873 RepID=A0AAU7M6Z3_9ACTN
MAVVTVVLATVAFYYSATADAATGIADGKKVTVSSTERKTGHDLSGRNAVDGDSRTRWSSRFADKQWIRIDLGRKVHIGRVVLRWEAAYGKAYEIQVSANGDDWKTAYRTTTGDGGKDELTVNATGRYVRMYGTVRATRYGFSLYEFEVHAATSGSTPPPTKASATPTAKPSPGTSRSSAPGSTVMPSAGGPAISPLLVGNNAWYYPSDKVWKASRGAGLKIVRIGGHDYDEKMPSNAQLETWVKQIKAMGAEPMIQVSKHRSPEDAANVVRYFNSKGGNYVKYWNIGNETWIDAGKPSKNEELRKLAFQEAGYIKARSSAMKAVDPSIRIFGPDEAGYIDTIYNSLLGGEADITGKDAKGRYYIDGVTWHRYVGGDLATAGANDIISGIKKARAKVDEVNKKRGRTGGNALQWGIGEFNSKAGGGACSYAAGQMFAQVYGAVMKYGGAYATAWSMAEHGGSCTESDFGFLDANLKPRSTYYHLQLVSQNFTGRYADGTSNVSTMRTYGAVDGGKVAVMLVNVGGKQTCKVRLNTDGQTGGCTVDIGAGLKVTHTQTIGAATSMVLVFDKSGKLTKRITYAAGGAPRTETF